MENKKFGDLTQLECLSSYKKMESNSDRRWKSAELLAADKDYGGAIRDHITSIEELIKAMIIYLDANGFEFRKVDGMNRILTKSHSLRHFMAYFMFVLNVFTEDIKRFYQQISKDPSLIKKWGGKRKIMKGGMNKFFRFYFFKKVLKLQVELKWFAKVESLRQTGTHVDYDNELITPEDISQNDYEQVLLRLSNVRFIGKEFIKTFDAHNSVVAEEIEKLKKDLHEKGWYLKISEAIKGVKNQNPFELFTKEFEFLEVQNTAEFKQKLRTNTLLEGPEKKTKKLKKG